LIALCSIHAHLAAQTIDLTGSIEDPSGAVVPGALVTLTAGSSVRQTAVSGQDGGFAFRSIRPGTYALRIDAAGFATLIREMVNVAAPPEALRLRLEPRAVTEQITVSAEKREQGIAPTPAAVSVMNAQQVEAADVDQFKRIAEYVPNFRFTDTGGRATFGYITMRGYTNPPSGVDSSVAVYIDGVPTSDFFSYNQMLFDVDQIEVLKGPQATLYGVNAEAGVVTINSRPPSNDRRGQLQVSYGNFNEYDATGSLSLPLVKNSLFLLVAGGVDGRDGTIRNVVSGNRYDFQESQAGRARLTFAPNPRFSATLTLSGSRIDDGGGYIYLPTDRATYNTIVDPRVRVGTFEQAINHDGDNQSQAHAESLVATYVGRRIEAVFTGANRHNRQEYSFDADLTPQAIFVGRSRSVFRERYYEGRLQSPRSADGPLTWPAGMAVGDFDRRYRLAVIAEAGNPFGLPPGSSPLTDPDHTGRNIGVFGQGTYRLADQRLGVTLGLRYDHADRSVQRPASPFGYEAIDADYDASILLPKVTVDYRMSSRTMVYGTVGRTWKAGGVNPFAVRAVDQFYRDAVSVDYEVGIKTTALRDRLSIRAATFYNNVRHYQDAVMTGAGTAVLSNARRVGISGMEVEATFAAGRGLEVSGALGAVRPRYKDYVFDAARDVRFDGKRVSQVPTFDLSLAGTYRFATRYFVRAELLAGGDFRDYYYTPAAGLLREFQFGRHAVANLRGGYDRGRFAIEAFVMNVGDTQYFTNSTTAYIDGFSPYGEPIGVVGARRRAGVRMFVRY